MLFCHSTQVKVKRERISTYAEGARIRILHRDPFSSHPVECVDIPEKPRAPGGEPQEPREAAGRIRGSPGGSRKSFFSPLRLSRPSPASFTNQVVLF